jgi:hypothetical protein
MSGNYKTGSLELEEIPKFDNVLLELDFFKKKCEVLERDLFKSQTQIKKHDLTIKKLQDHITLYGQNTNNTSNSFLLPSEFKSNWESLAQDLIMEAYENIYDSNILLAQLVQETFRLVYEEAKMVIGEKIKIILNSLNIEENNYEKFFIKFRLIFQEYFSVIFLVDADRVAKIKNNLKKCISNLDSNREEDINKDIESPGMLDFIKMSFKLSIFMHLHDPQLSISINLQNNSNSNGFKNLIYYFYNKSDHLNIEGFAKESVPCLVILPPPLLRSNFPYQGIKPAVYIVTNITEEILKECEKNKVTTNAKQRSYSSSDLPKDIEKERKNSQLTAIGIPVVKEGTITGNCIKVNSKSNSLIMNTNPSGTDGSNKENKYSDNKGNNTTPNHSTITSPINKIKVTSPTHTRVYTKPNSADFTNVTYNYQVLNKDNIKIQSWNKTPPIGGNFNTNVTLSNKLKKAFENKSDKNKNDHSDQPLNICIIKVASPTKEKPKIEPLNITHINSVSPTPNNPNVSRNSSLNIESFNNSFNKDSLRSNDINFNQQKTGRTSKNSPTQIDSGRSEYPGLTGLTGFTGLHEKLNNISFISIRQKTSSKDNSVSRHEKSLEISNKNNNESAIRINLNTGNGNLDNNNVTANRASNKNSSSSNNITNYSNNFNFNFSNNNKFNNNPVNNCNNSNTLPLNRSKNTLTKYASKNINNFGTNSKNNIYNISNTIFSNSNSKENFSFRNNATSNNTTSGHNKNTSQISESNNKVNHSQNQSSNHIIEVSNTGSISSNYNNNCFKSKTMKLTSAAFKDPNINLLVERERDRESPKVSYTSKIKTMVENMSASSLGNNFSNASNAKSGKHIQLEYLNKEGNTKSDNCKNLPSTKSKSNPPQVIFNGNIENNNYNYNYNYNDKVNNYMRSSHVNTDSNYNSNSQNTHLFIEDSNSSRERRYDGDRLMTKSENSCSNLNDMKFNGPKRDEFSNSISSVSKISKMTLSREKSKEYVLTGKIPDVQFSFKADNLSNYIVKKEDSGREKNLIVDEMTVTGKFPGADNNNTFVKAHSSNAVNVGRAKIERLYPKDPKDYRDPKDLKEKITYNIGKESPKNAENNFVNPFNNNTGGLGTAKFASTKEDKESLNNYNNITGAGASFPVTPVGLLNSNNYSNLNREKSIKSFGIKNSKALNEVANYDMSNNFSSNAPLLKTRSSKLNFNISNVNNLTNTPAGGNAAITGGIPIFNYTNTNLPTPMARHKKN